MSIFSYNDLSYVIVDSSYISIVGGSPSGTLIIPSVITHNINETYEVQEISANAFTGNSSITLIDASNSNLRTIKSQAFKDCHNITNVSLINSQFLNTISYMCFFNDYYIDFVDLFGCTSLTTIESSAFEACFRLSYINFANCNSLTTLGDIAFRCTTQNPNRKLVSIDFSDSYKLSNIGYATFNNDLSLNSITFGSRTKPTMASGVFNNIDPNANIYVNWWADFSNVIQGIPVVKIYSDLDYEIKSSDSISNVNYASLKRQYLSTKFTALRNHLDNSLQLNRNLNLPETIDGYPLKELQPSAFFNPETNNMKLYNITIPNTVIEIGAQCFGRVSSDPLYDVSTNSAIQDAFNNSIRNAMLPIGELEAIISGTQRNRLLTIDSALFFLQARIQNIFIPDTVDTMSSVLFKYTPNLQRIFFAGNKPSDVDNDIFFDMSSNPIIYISPWATGWSSTFGGNETLDVSLNLNNQGLTYYSEQINLLQDSSFNKVLTSNDLSGDLTCFIYSQPNHGLLFDESNNIISTINGHYVLPSNYIKYVSNSYYHGVDTIKYYLIDNSRNFVEYHQLDINISQQFLNSTWVNISNLYQFTRTDADLSNVNIFIDAGETPQSLGLVGPNPGTVFRDGFSSFTAMTWLYFDESNGNPVADYGIIGSNALHLIIRKDNSFPYARYYFGFFGQDITDGPEVSLREWQHVTYYFDSTTRTMKMYIDGIQHATEHNPMHLNNTSDKLYFGSWFNSIDTFRRFRGYLANTLIFNTNLSDVAINHFKNTYPVYGGTINGLEYTILNPLYATIINGTNVTGNVVVPATITHNGTEYPVIQIFNNAFLSNTSIITIQLSPNITSIGDNAFSGCTNLTSIQLPISITSIGDHAFSGCTNLTSINLEECIALISLGEKVFFNCSKLENLNLSGLTNLDTHGKSIYEGSSIKNIILPDNLKFIGEHAFKDCTDLKFITFNGRVPVDLNTLGISEATTPFLRVNPEAIIRVYYRYSSTNPINGGQGFLTEYVRGSTIPVVIIDPPPPTHCCPPKPILNNSHNNYKNGQNSSKLFTCINASRYSRVKRTIHVSQSNFTNICDPNIRLNININSQEYQQHVQNINDINNSNNCNIRNFKFRSKLFNLSLF